MATLEHWFVEVNRWALAVLLGAMSVIVFANVTLRYLTSFSITWSEEAARYLMVWMTFIGAGLLMRVGGHVAISNLQEAIPAKMQRLLRGIIAAILLAFFLVMAWIGLEYMQRTQVQLTPATRISFRYIYSAIPIGFVLLIIHLLLIIRGFVAEHRFESLGSDADGDDFRLD